MKNLALYTFLFVTLLLGCRGEKPKRIPDTLPDVRGSITSMKPGAPDNKQALAIIHVQAVEGVESKSQEANIIVDKHTLIKNSEGELIKPAQLREGLEVEVWVGEEVLETFPVQSKATAIRITSESK